MTLTKYLGALAFSCALGMGTAARAQAPSCTVAPGPGCLYVPSANWDRPHDIRAVLDALERLAVGEFAGQIDLRRMAVGGHSAGSGGALTVAGARRLFGGAPVTLADPRPIAFLAFSPQQPGSEGFFDTRFKQPRSSWSGVRRPVLTASGK